MALYDFVKRHALISTLIVLWAITLTTWATYQVFGETPPDIPAGTAAAYATLFGLPTLAVGLWKWRREQK